nr:MAG TPA: hypothetical protein [Crassvirales sp.]
MFDNTLDLCSLSGKAFGHSRPAKLIGIGNDTSHLISEILQLISEANQLIS